MHRMKTSSIHFLETSVYDLWSVTSGSRQIPCMYSLTFQILDQMNPNGKVYKGISLILNPGKQNTHNLHIVSK